MSPLLYRLNSFLAASTTVTLRLTLLFDFAEVQPHAILLAQQARRYLVLLRL